MFERARYLREANWDAAARQLLARQHNFTAKPVNPERFLDQMVTVARAASADRQFQLAYDIARQVDDLFPAGTSMASKSYAIRDDYTSTHHARLMLWSDQWMIQDLDSTNGTFLNGKRVSIPTPVPLNTPVSIGTTTFELRR